MIYYIGLVLFYSGLILLGLSSWDQYASKYRILYDHTNVIGPQDTELLISRSAKGNLTYELLQFKNYDYLCGVPSLQKLQLESEASLKNNGTSSLSRKEELQIATERLTKLQADLAAKNICLIYPSNYWAYKFCFQKDLIQFHFTKDNFQREPDVPVYVLGKVPANHANPQFEIVDGGFGESDDVAYVSELMGDGSVCDLTGKPRVTFIRYKCGLGLKHPVIQEVFELKSCEYQMTILVNELCDLESFKPMGHTVDDITCRLIDIPQENRPERMVSLENFKMSSLGFNVFVGILPSERLTVLFTNKLDPKSNLESLRNSVSSAIFNSIKRSQFKVPRYVLQALHDSDPLANDEVRPIGLNDSFIYISKLYNLNGEFIDTIQYFVDLTNHVTSFRFGTENSKDAPVGEWSGLEVELDEVPIGNFIMFNGIRFKGVPE